MTTEQTLRFATWNMKQAVAPKRPLPELWDWLGEQVQPSVVVLTEAKVPSTGLPAGWTALWEPTGIGPSRRWGTVIAARGVELREIECVSKGGPRVDELWPGTMLAADVYIEGARWGMIVGLYALTVDSDGKKCGHGRHTSRRQLQHIETMVRSKTGGRLIVAGDFNIWPCDLPRRWMKSNGLIDLAAATASQRSPLEGCSGCTEDEQCGHLWTHRNGNKPGAARQQLDFIFASRSLADALTGYGGGVESFPDAWDLSDHAPVFADFRSQALPTNVGRQTRVRVPRRRTGRTLDIAGGGVG